MESTPLGTQYEIDPSRKQSGTMVCTKCMRGHRVTLVWVERRIGATDQKRGGWLPLEIFDYEEVLSFPA